MGVPFTSRDFNSRSTLPSHSARANPGAEGDGARRSGSSSVAAGLRDRVDGVVLAGLLMRQRRSIEVSVLTETLISSGDSSCRDSCS